MNGWKANRWIVQKEEVRNEWIAQQCGKRVTMNAELKRRTGVRDERRKEEEEEEEEKKRESVVGGVRKRDSGVGPCDDHFTSIVLHCAHYPSPTPTFTPCLVHFSQLAVAPLLQSPTDQHDVPCRFPLESGRSGGFSLP